jgi:hypothetical protein
MQLSAGLPAAAAGPPAAAPAAGRPSYRQASQLLAALLRYDSLAGRAPLPGDEAGGAGGAAGGPDGSPFSAAFEAELHRAKRFIAGAYERAWRRVDALADRCEAAAAGADGEEMARQCCQLGAPPPGWRSPCACGCG